MLPSCDIFSAGLIISKLFSCLLEWLMTIEPEILTDTELCQLVFDVIEYAIHVSTVSTEKEEVGSGMLCVYSDSACALIVHFRMDLTRFYLILLSYATQPDPKRRKYHSSSSC